MNYIGSGESINWLFILCCLSILQWLLTIIYVSKNYHILGREITLEKLRGYDKKISFTHDYFYLYWNIYPIIFYMLFYYLDTSWNTYLNQIIMIGGDKVQSVYNSWFISTELFSTTVQYLWIDTLVLVIIIIIAYKATFSSQITKQITFLKNKEKLYWWDIRIVKEIFWIRFIFLFFNMILVGFTAYLITKVAFFIMAILALENTLSINPFHPDLFGGLKILMEISSIILAIYFLRAMMGIVGFLDHRGLNDKFQTLGDYYHTSYFFLGIGFILFFIYKVNYLLETVDISTLLSNNIYQTYYIACDEKNISKVTQTVGNMSNYYSNLLQYNKFPIDLSLFTSSIFTFILPLSLWFIVSFMDNRKQEYIEIKGDKNGK